ncbi:MAG: hypothetical protein Q9227_001218 [Pyrenula ochraceoflavens]
MALPAYPQLIRSFLVPKNRRIIDLSNIPLTSGTCYVKWHLPSSTSAEHRGRTDKAVIKEHKAVFDYLRTLEVRLTTDRSAYLQESEIHFEVLQEYSVGVRGDRIVLGNIRLNLSEYVGKGDDDEGPTSHLADGDDAHHGPGITRRYLLQSSKINSTLKLRIAMRQLEGDKNYLAPPLKAPMVFGGIAGIMSAEQADPDDAGHMPSISSKTRDFSELQDIYRRTLAATWTCRAGEMAPDRLVEDLFQGGDGGSMVAPPNPFASRIFGTNSKTNHSPQEDENDENDDTETSDADSRRTVRGHGPTSKSRHHSRHSSGLLSPSSAFTDTSHDRHSHIHHTHHHQNTQTSAHTTPKLDTSPTLFTHSRHRPAGGSMNVRHGSVDTSMSASSSSSNLTNLTSVSGRGSIEGQMVGKREQQNHRHHHDRHRGGRGSGKAGRSGNGEVTEFDIREDLRSWNIGDVGE